MDKKYWIVGSVVFSTLIFVLLCLNHAESQSDLVKRGQYLVDALGACGQCHTPRKGAEMDMSMYLAGHPTNAPYPKFDMSMMQRGIFMVTAPTLAAFSMPFGTTFAGNLTPDKETGLGEWTEKMFIDTMRTGHRQGNTSNRKLLPPMPITNAYAKMTDEDLKAMWAYLQSIKPVKNQVPSALNRMGRPF